MPCCGNIEVFSTTTVNSGIIRAGKGGKASGCHAYVYGGDGGTVRIMADVQNPNNESKIYNAEIHAGNGGDAIGQAGLISAGLGGNLDVWVPYIGQAAGVRK